MLEDFHGTPQTDAKGSLKAADLQRLLDKYELRLNGKMATHRKAQFTFVIITTNLPFDQWFNGWWGIKDTVKESIRSRITQWTVYTGEDKRATAQTTRTIPPSRMNEATVVCYSTPEISLASSGSNSGAAPIPSIHEADSVEEDPSTGLFL